MKIRAYKEGDRAQLIALWRVCGLVKPQNDPGKDIDRKLQVNPELLLVGEEAGVVMASVMAGYEGHRGWVNYLAVDPARRRRGYGEIMMSAAEEQLMEKGCPKINLQIRDTNSEVIAFYAAIGYLEDEVVSMGKRLEFDE